MSLNARSYLFDAGVLSLFYEGEERIRPYFQRVFSSKATGYVSELNLAEFYYKSALHKGLEVVDVWYRQIRQSEFEIVPPDETITRSAAVWKVRKNELSLGDCFALATTQEKAHLLLTTDSYLAKIKEVKSVHFAI